MTPNQSILTFLAGKPHAVVGASTDRAKYGNKVLRCYLQHDREVYPINASAVEVEGLTAYKDLKSLPIRPHGVSIITPPPVTEKIVEQIGELSIQHVWMQPGAESPRAIQRCKELGINLIAGGPCLLVVLGYNDQA